MQKHERRNNNNNNKKLFHEIENIMKKYNATKTEKKEIE